jgi:hypothetical protein
LARPWSESWDCVESAKTNSTHYQQEQNINRKAKPAARLGRKAKDLPEDSLVAENIGGNEDVQAHNEKIN